MSILAIVGAVIIVAIVVILILASQKPDTFRVLRSTTIKAPPEKIFPLINDFQNWRGWSPWEKIDPALQRTYSGPQSGQGAFYAWESKKVGKGSMEITQSVPSSKVALKLDFVKPFEAHNTVVFTLQPAGDGTAVSWDMQGRTPFMGKVMHVFMNMDRMVGKDFETGLANLKAMAER